MTLVRSQASNHPQQVGSRGARPEVDDRATTLEVFGPLHDRFHFTLDAAASAENTKLPRFFDLQTDGLIQPWGGERVWCNPPYSEIRPWVEKAWAETADLVVMLLPSNRTEQAWWQDLVEPFRDRAGSPLTTEFIRGRVRFLAPGATEIGPDERPPFGNVLLIWNREVPRLQGFQESLRI